MLFLMLTIIIIILFPEDALAWGPLTHVQLGMDLLSNPLVPGAISLFIKDFPYHFLYGTIIADVILWKNRMRYSKHCHNWKIGFEILNQARTPPLKAFAYGYISHLSADIIAHNLYIPQQMILNYPLKKGKHIVWEIRYERWIDSNIWKMIKKIPKNVDSSCDELLENVLQSVIFSYKTNKRIFSVLFLLHRMESWRLRNGKKNLLPEKSAVNYYKYSLSAIISVFSEMEKSPFLKYDPTGRQIIKRAENMRKLLKGLKGEEREKKREFLLNKLKRFQPFLVLLNTSSNTFQANSSFEHFSM